MTTLIRSVYSCSKQYTQDLIPIKSFDDKIMIN